VDSGDADGSQGSTSPGDAPQQAPDVEQLVSMFACARAAPPGIDADAWECRDVLPLPLAPLPSPAQLAAMSREARLSHVALLLIQALELTATFARLDADHECAAVVLPTGTVVERPDSREVALLALFRARLFSALHEPLQFELRRLRTTPFRLGERTAATATELLLGIGTLLQMLAVHDAPAVDPQTTEQRDRDALMSALADDIRTMRRRLQALAAFGFDVDAAARGFDPLPPKLLADMLRCDWSELRAAVELELAQLGAAAPAGRRSTSAVTSAPQPQHGPARALALLAKDPSLAQLPDDEVALRFGVVRQTLFKRGWATVRKVLAELRQRDPPRGDVDPPARGARGNG
jgi:hypothetical protein